VSYRVVVTRDDTRWLAEVPELSGAHACAGPLRTLDRDVREAVVMAAELPGPELGYEYRLG
jgi:hypothetical protein